MATIKERLEGLSGQDYYFEWRRCWWEIREEAREAVAYLKAARGGLSVNDLVDLADLFSAPFKPLVEALEADGQIPFGSYAGLRDAGFSVDRRREQLRQERFGPSPEPMRRKSELTPLRNLLQKEMAL